ncbi:hypothetical protein PPACK8108_LOCUS17114 [Phakopsora pachyrhizi]|uniref:Uncharacterized protein n=1 Tax=Phakopsora pachyrhizi TaxID=170000 RepID=A0AAV0B8L9_PHAPC|nr:hypothetical protein PPACK8108_LOCUS17114 [Phakopsora pachyrhizi]
MICIAHSSSLSLDSSNHTKTCSPMPKAQLYSTAFICTQMLIFFFCLDLSTVPSELFWPSSFLLYIHTYIYIYELQQLET